MEVEAKVALPDRMDPQGTRRDAWDQAITRLGATALGGGEQVDTYFQHPSRDLKQHDEALRVRRDGGWTLTYKGPRGKGKLKVRKEHNLHVHEDPGPLLAALGFRPAARIQKHRREWKADKVTVALDDVPGLGRFVEVEAHADAPDPGAKVRDALALLGLDNEPLITRSYLELAAEAGVLQTLE